MEFSVPWHALFGGALLGLSAGVLMLYSGKVAGISGVVSGMLSPLKGDMMWRLTFITGMVSAFIFVRPFGFSLPQIESPNILIVILAGLLVGFGTRLGNGCTSGHGIVGMGRLSKRSIYATVTFMFTAIAVVWLKRQLGIM
ncbi:YeeE/YedE family protein [Vibrio sp. T187]|uniref:YeeE/YedE family protein n=1 Tax=Vibrio TaxID=662 RepID=UPI0010C96336|nr:MULTISPECIES: YeeE/YedE thiosulfate transporter family protein [Vibrio]MBW3698086.1 YeeE/YedE family protein [Vibrio sp. T187]